MSDDGSSREPGRNSAGDRTVKSATEARQGDIVLGRYSHLIWIGALVVIAVLAVAFWAV